MKATPIKVFICYRQGDDGHNPHADNLYTVLLEANERKAEFEPWRDRENVRAGAIWEKRIFQNLLDSDVMLLVLGPDTSKSDFIPREISLARAIDLQIVPIAYDCSRDAAVAELKRLGISDLQAELGDEIPIDQLKELLRGQAKITKNHQAQLEWFPARRAPQKEVAESNLRGARFVIDQTRCSVYLATGDFSEFTNVDVIVNSENDYMQMARIFESQRVSSILRDHGARHLGPAQYEDTVQKELDMHLGNKRPVPPGYVVATSAGARNSLLWNRGIRYLFHVAAVQALPDKRRVEPFSDPGVIAQCVGGCLNAFRHLHDNYGVISPKGSEERREQEKRRNDWRRGKVSAKSILFPLFGTGHGGKEPAQVVSPMLDSMTRILAQAASEVPALPLEEIFLSVYYKDDIDEILEKLRSHKDLTEYQAGS